jgi:peptidoglycan/xylan/chitin deacetylase (PgdA/CDA1 family)
MTWKTRFKDLIGVTALPSAERARVLFTFDDGPHPDGTTRVLDVLKRYGARAVFFVVGSRIDRAPHLLQRILDEGHVLGNHSFAHDRASMAGISRYLRDLERCQSSVQRLTGTVPFLFRPPLGEITGPSLFAPRALGLRTVFWSVDSDDWRMRAESDVVACEHRLMEALAGRGLHDIVLMHDERVFTANVLDRVLPLLVERGVDVSTGVQALR